MRWNFKRNGDSDQSADPNRQETADEPSAVENLLGNRYRFRIQLLFEGVVIGLVTGVLIVLYRLALEKIRALSSFVYHNLTLQPQWIPLWIGALAIVGFLIARLLRYEPMASGSGIPQVEGQLSGKLSVRWYRVIFAKFVGGVLALGAGLSLGREGPSVQLGAAVGQGFARIFKRLRTEERFLITSGASAGLSAAFNAPLAGVMFALEEVHKNFSAPVLISSLVSALAADFVSSAVFGTAPVLAFRSPADLPLPFYFYILLLGVIVGVFGVLFNTSLLATSRLYGKLRRIPPEYRIFLPLMAAVPLGFLLPEATGGGHEIIVTVLSNHLTLSFLVTVLIVKFLFTMLSYGSGAPGGIFLPLLTIGALTGGIFGLVLVRYAGFDEGFVGTFAVLAMAAYFTAIVRAPITGIILITEMTGSFQYLLPLALVSVTAYIVADLMGSQPIYEALLERMTSGALAKNNPQNAKNKTVIELCICMGSTMDGREVRDIRWPAHCLLIAVRRGGKEIIPKGDTVLKAGDYLSILSDQNAEADIRASLAPMQAISINKKN